MALFVLQSDKVNCIINACLIFPSSLHFVASRELPSALPSVLDGMYLSVLPTMIGLRKSMVLIGNDSKDAACLRPIPLPPGG